ncbi:MAG TPA: O-antigen polymerase [Gemmatimonadaceae bacterium]
MITPIMLSVVIVGLAVFMRLGAGTWLHPAAFFSGWWMLAAIMPMIVAPQEPVSAGAVAWVIAACLAVSAGAVAGNGGLVTRRVMSDAGVSRFEASLVSWPMLIALGLGMLSNIAFAMSSGVSASDLLDIQRLVVVSNQAYAARYAETGAPPPPRLVQAMLPFVYLAPALGGIVFVARRELRWKLAAMATMAPAVAVTVLQTTKAAVLFGGTLWLCSYFAMRLRFGKLKVVTRGHLLTAAVLGALVTVFFVAVGFARLASTDASLIGLVRLKLITAAFGHMGVFSSWLNDYWTQPFGPTLGAYTFAGPLELMGIKQRVPGVFENVVELIAGETSNIYTGFRPLIEDFGMPASLAILGALGVIGGWAYRAVSFGRWGALPALIAAYMTMLWTPITWFWIYNSLTATVIAVGFLVFFIRLWRRSRPRVITGGRIVRTIQ